MGASGVSTQTWSWGRNVHVSGGLSQTSWMYPGESRPVPPRQQAFVFSLVLFFVFIFIDTVCIVSKKNQEIITAEICNGVCEAADTPLSGLGRSAIRSEHYRC